MASNRPGDKYRRFLASGGRAPTIPSASSSSIPRVPLPNIFGREAKAKMRKEYLSEKTEAIVGHSRIKRVSEYLLLDDRLYCDYLVDTGKLDIPKKQVTYTGYFRGYDAKTATIFVSPYVDSTELGIVSGLHGKVSYLSWPTEKIEALYINKDDLHRITTKIKGHRALSTSDLKKQ
jgi:hypothetical protein